jgi:hypothetical protein
MGKIPTQLETDIPFNLGIHIGVDIDTRVENFSEAVLRALGASTPKSRPSDDILPPIPAGIQDEIRLKNQLWRRCRITRDHALRAEVNRLQRSVTNQLNEWMKNQWGETLESINPEHQSLWRMTKWTMRFPTHSLPWSLRGNRSL